MKSGQISFEERLARLEQSHAERGAAPIPSSVLAARSQKKKRKFKRDKGENAVAAAPLRFVKAGGIGMTLALLVSLYGEDVVNKMSGAVMAGNSNGPTYNVPTGNGTAKVTSFVGTNRGGVQSSLPSIRAKSSSASGPGGKLGSDSMDKMNAAVEQSLADMEKVGK